MQYVHHGFERQVDRDPDAAAVICDGERLAYGELEVRANQIAYHLRRFAVGPDVAVGVCLPRSFESITCMLGVLKAGGAYVPLDPSYPAERLAFMIEDARIAALLTSDAIAAQLGPLGAPVVVAGRDPANEPTSRLSSAPLPEQLAYVIYTSGSTGQPKGCAISHRNLVHLVSWQCRTFELASSDRVSHVAGLSFDASVWEVWSALVAGATLVLPDEPTRTSPERLLAWLGRERVSVAFLPTPIAEVVLRELRPPGEPFRLLTVGGDALHAIGRSPTPFPIVNVYGPAECTVASTTGLVDASSHDAPTVGIPLDGVRVDVLDEQLSPAGAGAACEVYIAGVGVGRGYLGQPALTAERFVPDPLATEPGGRMYRTGDLGRRTASGELFVLGRLDSQIKIRGNRIELGEVEAALAEHRGVRECVAVACEDEDGEKRLVAYVVGRAAPPDAGELRAYLHAKLPPYAVPSAFVSLAAMPLTPNGKVDRRALPAPDWSADASRFVAPRTPTELAIAVVWSEVLGVPRVGVHDDFFALGGHSLTAATIAYRLGDVLGVAVAVGDVLAARTIEVLARDKNVPADAAGGERIRARSHGSPALANDMQLRLWQIEEQLGSDALEHPYNEPLVVDLEGPVDVAILERALSWLVDRHEALRTRFQARDGELWQIVDPPAPVSLRVEDLRVLPTAEHERVFAQRCRDVGSRALDLRTRAWRALLLRRGEASYTLVLACHHSIVDGWSFEVLVRELATTYAAITGGRKPSLPLPGAQLGDYTTWEHELVVGSAREASVQFFRDRLAGAAPLPVPNGRLGGAAAGWSGDRRRTEFPGALVAQLASFAREEGITTFAVIAAATGLAVARWTGVDSFAMVTNFANRERAETEHTIGCLITTLPLRADLRGRPSFRGSAHHFHEQLVATHPHARTPWSAVRNLVGRGLELAIVAQDEIPDAAAGPIRIVGAREPSNGCARFDCALMFRGGRDRMACIAEYRTAVFDGGEVEALLADVIATLESGLAAPDEPVDIETAPVARVARLLGWDPGRVARIGVVTPAVRDLYADCVRTPELRSYRVHTVELRESIDPRRWQDAVGAVARRSEIACARLVRVRDEPLFVVDCEARSELEVIDCAADEDAEHVIRDRFQARFDLEHGPLARFALVRERGGRCFAVIAWAVVVGDAFSAAVMFEQIVRAYHNRDDELTRAPTYLDLAPEIRREVDRPEAIAYWRDRLAGVTPLPLPPRIAGAATSGTQTLDVAPDATAALRALTAQSGVDLACVIETLFASVVARCLRMDGDFVLCEVVSGRDDPARAHTIGGLGGQVPMRFSPRVLDDAVLAAIAATRVSRDAARAHPISARERARLFDQDLRLLFQLHEVAVTTYDQLGPGEVQLTVTDRGDRLQLLLHANAAPVLHLRLLERVELLAGQVIAGARLGEADLVLPDERPVLARYSAATPAVAPGAPELIHERFRAAAARRGDEVAIVDGEVRVSYRELDSRSNRIARHLRRHGVGRDAPVVLFVERSADLVAAMLGILKAGGAYVPLDPAYPRDRLGYILDDTRASIVITEPHLAAVLPAHEARIVDIHASELDGESDAPLEHTSDPRDLAYVIFTSGSTGRPKGVQITHRCVARLFDQTWPWYRFDDRDVWTFFHSAAFDWSVYEIWGALLYGGRVVVVPYLVSRLPDAFYELVCREQVTILCQTPSAFRSFIEADGDRARARALALRLVIFGGERLDPTFLQPWCERHGDQRPQLVNMYGITETCVHVTYRPIQLADLADSGSPVGIPIPDLSLYLLDSRMRAVPPGVVGEIYVGGPGLARGYRGQPTITAERFVAAPGGLGDRLYRSGDLARLRPNGELEYLGRADQQVKIRGFRIELGEIEAALRGLTGVRDAVVVVREDTGDDPRLVGYVIGLDASRAASPELRDRLATRLPAYMIPSAIVALDAFPLTANGKLDHRALPSPRIATGTAAPAEEGRDDLERRIATIWAEILGLPDVSLDADLFALGGNSLLAIRIVNQVGLRLSVKVSLKELYVNPTVRQMAAEARRSATPWSPGAGEQADSEVGVILRHVLELSSDEVARQLSTWEAEPEDVAVELPAAARPLSPDERRLARILVREHERDRDLAMPVRRRVRANGRSPASPIQHLDWDDTKRVNAQPIVPRQNRSGLVMCFSHQLHGLLDIDVLSRAVVELQQRHEILRSRFRKDESGTLWQETAVATPLAVEDLQDVPAVSRLDRARERYDELYARFDLEHEPPMKVRLLRLGPEHHILVLLVHHVAFDGASYPVLAEALANLYNSGLAGHESTLRPACQYADIAQRWLEMTRRPTSVEHLRFWTRKLAGLGAQHIEPLAQPEPNADSIHVPLSASARRDLAVAASAAGCAPWIVLFALFARTIGRRFARGKFVVLNTSARRTRAGTEGVIGPLYHPMPIVIDPLAASDGDAIRDLRDVIAEARDHGEQLPPPSDLLRFTDFNFNYRPTQPAGDVVPSALHDPPPPLRLAGLRCDPLSWGWTGDRFFKLKAMVVGAGADLDVALFYDPRFLRRADVEQLARELEARFTGGVGTARSAAQT